jgi:signal transduction histidine kinase
MIRRVARASDVKFTTTIASIDDLIPQDRHIHLFRIVQEAVSNVIEHSHATHASVSIWREGRQIHISVSDNGCGVSAEAQGKFSSTHQGLGLSGIRERARILGGKLDIVSSVASGTRVSLILMLERGTDG